MTPGIRLRMPLWGHARINAPYTSSANASKRPKTQGRGHGVDTASSGGCTVAIWTRRQKIIWFADALRLSRCRVLRKVLNDTYVFSFCAP